eukprot:scaffold156157_cov16-Tisochrysis_lutea.AAC.1
MFVPVDENAGLLHHGIHDKENSSSFVVGGSRGLAGSSGPGKNVLQPPSGRKALGNITNTTSKHQSGSSFGGAPEKGGKAAAPARRAFGVDITNSGALKQQQPLGDPSSVKRKPLQPLEPQQTLQTTQKQQLLPKSRAE